MKKSKLAGAIAFSLLSLNVHALSVGNMNVDSYLGEPLDISIDINSIDETEFSTLEVSLADREMFNKAGIEYPANANKLHIEVGPYENGRATIRVRTPGSVSDPFIHLLLNIAWSGGNILREYTALIDPADYKVDPVTQAAAPATTLGVAKPATPSDTDSAEDLYRTVETGDSLSAIAAMYRPSDVSRQQAWMAFYNLNPQAFPDGNLNNIKSGARLQIPSESQMRATSQADAVQDVKDLSKPLTPASADQKPAMAVVEPVEKSPALIVGGSSEASSSNEESAPIEEKMAPEMKSESMQLSAGAGSGQVGQLVTEFNSFTQTIEQEISGARERDVKFKEELIATRGENRVLTERMTNLEAQISRMTQLLELQGNALQAMSGNTTGVGQAADVRAALEQMEQVEEAPAVADTQAVEGIEPAEDGEAKTYYEQLLEEAMSGAPEEDKSYIDEVLGQASTSIGLQDTNPVTPEMKAKAAASKAAGPSAPADQATEDMLASVRESLGQLPAAPQGSLPSVDDVEIDTEDLAYLDALNEEDRDQIEKSEARIAELELALQEKIKAAQGTAPAPAPFETAAPVSESAPVAGTSEPASMAEKPATTEPSPADTSLVGSLISQAKDAFSSAMSMLSGLSADAWRVISGVGAVFIGLMLISRIRRRRSDSEEIPPRQVADIAFGDEDEQDVADIATQSMAQDQELDDLEEELHGSSLFDLSDESFMASEVIQDDSSLFSMDENEDLDSLANMDSEQIGQQSTMTQVVDVDPVAEADVYLAYDRKEQAIEVLEQALTKEPNQSTVVIKLLELYQDNEDTEGFSKLFESSAEHIEDDDDWNKIKIMAQEFVPGHEMLADDFDSSIPVLNEKADTLSETADEGMQLDALSSLELESEDEAVAEISDTIPSDLDEELDTATEEINQHEPDTALALAKAYIELGEEDIAKDFLQDVINANDEKLKKEAEEMLNSLG